MLRFEVSNLRDLKDCLAECGEDVLFRGQTRHYETAEGPSATTSFDRLGCIPTEMLRWSRYADEVLSAFTGGLSDSTLNQAILQHYGFRSFYLDCSGAAAVSAWFAGHQYSDAIGVEMSEDCDEDPILLRKKMARYDPAEGQGHLYVLDRAMCQRVGLTDLTAMAIPGSRTRPSVQNAYLLGPLRRRPLPVECFLAHIKADCAVFREMANEAGFVAVEDVFPPSTDDPILDALLSLPWNPVPGVPNEDGDIPAFRRAIELPEYDDSYVKIASPAVAFYRGGKIDELFDQVEGFRGGIGVQVPEITIFGSPDRRFLLRFPSVVSLLEKHKGVIFEAPALMKFPQTARGLYYQKGLALDLVEPDLVHLGPLMVRHPGQRIDAAGVGRGWFYRVGKDGIWRRETRQDECPCGSDRPHLRHLDALHIVEHFLTEPGGFDEDG